MFLSFSYGKTNKSGLVEGVILTSDPVDFSKNRTVSALLSSSFYIHEDMSGFVRVFLKFEVLV